MRKKAVFLIVAGMLFIAMLVIMRPGQGVSSGSIGVKIPEIYENLTLENPEREVSNIERSIIRLGNDSEKLKEIMRDLQGFKDKLYRDYRFYEELGVELNNSLEELGEVSLGLEDLNQDNLETKEIIQEIVQEKIPSENSNSRLNNNFNIDLMFIINFILLLFNLLAFSFWMSNKRGKLKNKKYNNKYVDLTHS